MAFDNLLLERDGAVAILTINRPKVLNALNTSTIDDLRRAVLEVKHDPGIRVVIIEPGITKSAMFAKNTDAPNHTGAYDAHYRRMFSFYAAGIPVATDPFEVAAIVHGWLANADVATCVGDEVPVASVRPACRASVQAEV